jgi:hypothetical protein
MNAHDYMVQACRPNDSECEFTTGDDGCEAETGDCSCTVWDLCVTAAEHDRLLAIVWRHIIDLGSDHLGRPNSSIIRNLRADLEKAGFVPQEG